MGSRTPNLIRALRQAGGIIVMACLLAVCTNLLRESGIPFVGDWSPAARFANDSGQSQVIGLAEASRMYAENKAVFIDARSEAEYADGHIKDALNLPWHEVHERFMEIADRLEEEKTLVCYCDGENCELSHELALFFSDMGFEHVRVLVNGWTVWREAGLPTQTKGQGDEHGAS